MSVMDAWKEPVSMRHEAGPGARSASPVILDSCPSSPELVVLSPRPSKGSHGARQTERREVNNASPAPVGELGTPKVASGKDVLDAAKPVVSVAGGISSRASQPFDDSQVSTRRKLEEIDLTKSPIVKALKKPSIKPTGLDMARPSPALAAAKLSGQVTKPQARANSRGPVATTCAKPTNDVINSPQPPLTQGKSLHLEKALKRRLDWTPPKNSMGSEDIDLCGSPDSNASPQKSTKGIFAKFGYDASDTSNTKVNPERTTNKKPLELLPFPRNGPNGGNSERTKAPRQPRGAKKWTTITSHATARYKSPDANNENIQRFFRPGQKEDLADTTRPTGRKRSSRKANRSLKRQDEERTVDAPADAVKTLNDQEWQFGTYSQLARSSVTPPRRTSASDSDLSQSSAYRASTTSAFVGSTYAASRNLWSAGARDEAVELRGPGFVHEPSPTDTPNFHSSGTVAGGTADGDAASRISESDVSATQEDTSLDVLEEIFSPTATQQAMPNFNDYTPEALAGELSAYGLKPIKSRKKAIEVLEECWKSTHKGPPPSTRLRPQAADAEQTAPLTGEIHSPKPAMDNKSVSSLTEDPTQSQRSTTSTAPSTAAPDLAEQLLKAIQSQPKVSTQSGEKQLRWHEKILLYDPIQVDDLTVWLNTGGLDNIGEDREVSPTFVKEWCENKGICCIWK